MRKEIGFITAVLFIIAQSTFPELSAQPGMAATIPFDGYVILNNGDTLTGKIRWSLKYVENNPVEIKFIDESGYSEFFKADAIRGFGNTLPGWTVDEPEFLGQSSQDYISVPSFKKNIPVFMHRLLEGRIIVLQNRKSGMISSSTTVVKKRFDGIAFSWSPGEGLSIGPSYRTDFRVIEARTRFTSYFIIKEKKPIIKIDKDNYEENFDSLFGDCPAISEELNKNPDLRSFRNFMILTEVYNRICQ